MIKVIWNLAKSFVVNNKSYLLLGIALIVTIFGAYRLGIKDGKATAKQEYTELQAKQAVDTLNQFIEGTKQLTQAANDASKALSEQIVERKLYDEESTKSLQDALKRSANSRSTCLFDDNVLQLIDNARNNAVRATTSGITRSNGDTLRSASEKAK